MPNCDPVQEVSIIPRGMAGGYTQTLPSEDSNYTTRGQLLDRMDYISSSVMMFVLFLQSTGILS